ncbi:Transposase, partial (plasmid) [Streptomyces clavuligerus]
MGAEELISVWTLLEEDMGRLRNKSGANRLGFALLLKFSQRAAPGPLCASMTGHGARPGGLRPVGCAVRKERHVSVPGQVCGLLRKNRSRCT